MQEVELRTGVWYNDRPVILTFPDSWDVITHWPATPPPLSDSDIWERINSPVGQAPLRELAVGKKRVVVVVDDLARPTPVRRIMPHLLEVFAKVGIPASEVRILVGTGAHGDQNRDGLVAKIGRETFDSCKIIVHSDTRRNRFIGRTSFGSPVYVDSELVKSDLIVGIGGVYPQHTVGFGGGGKLALGVLGRKSIIHLHYGHPASGGTYDVDNDFRADVTEMVRMMQLNTMFTMHIDGQQRLVNLVCGDYHKYYPESVEFSRWRYDAPLPDDADMVIANAYPSDNSYFFLRKSMKPIRCAHPSAVKVVVASNHEGLGSHGLFQPGKNPRLHRYKVLYYRASMKKPSVIAAKVVKALYSRLVGSRGAAPPPSPPSQKLEKLWLYAPDGAFTQIPENDGIVLSQDWARIIDSVNPENSSDGKIKVRIYPCASMQCLDAPLGVNGESGE